MVNINNFLTGEYIDYPDNISYLRELNKICMEELSFDAGNIRTVPVAIGGTSCAPEIPQETVIINKLEEMQWHSLHMQLLPDMA